MNHKQKDPGNRLPILAPALYFTLCGNGSDLIANVLDCVPAQRMLIFEEGTVPFIKFDQAITDSGLMIMKDVCVLVETKIKVQTIS